VGLINFTATDYPPKNWRFGSVQLWVWGIFGWDWASVNERLEQKPSATSGKQNHSSGWIVYNDGASNAGRNNFPLSVRDATGSDEDFVA
jgi:hypothetical protein